MGNVIVESIAGCFIVLIACVVGISNGPVGLVSFYEKEVQDRVVELGLTSEKKIKRNSLLFSAFGIIPFFVFVILSVYGINGAKGFWEGFWQICFIIIVEGIFDRLFIDWYWVGKTKTWVIPGTEDLMPYIYGKTLAIKWIGTLIGYPLIAAAISGIMTLFIN